MNRAVRTPLWLGLLTAIVALATWFGLGGVAATQTSLPASQLIAADPMPNARLAVAPDRIALTFAEPVDAEGARIRLLGAGGVEIPLTPAQRDPDLLTRLVARPRGPLGIGDFTVAWSARTADDGALLAGAYPFRAGDVDIPGAAELAGQWPAPWATLLRWVVFLGTAFAGGGFAWSRLLAPRASSRAPGSPVRLIAMATASLVAFLATVAAPLLARSGAGDGEALSLSVTARAMPLGWWLQFVALIALALLCFGVLASGRATTALPATLDWAGLTAGSIVLAGLSLTSHAAEPVDVAAFTLEIGHQWSTALWVSGLLFFLAGWRGLGSDVARFRTVRWIGGLLIAVSVFTGLASAARQFSTFGEIVANRYGQVLAAKSIVVLGIVALGAVAMLAPRHANAVQASRFLGAQGLLAVLATLLSALLALMAAPGAVVLSSLAGVAQADIVPVDRAAFDAGNGTIHLLTQPATPGVQTLVVRLTHANGAPLTSARPPAVQVIWTPLQGSAATEESSVLMPDPSGALFTGTAMLPDAGWQQVDVIVTPPNGIASRARFWLVLPDPNISGGGPGPASDPVAAALYERGLESLTALRSVSYTQRLADGGGSFSRTRVSVSAADGERPAAYTEAVIDAEGNVTAQQTIVGARRWLLHDGEWTAAEPIPFLAPAAWGDAYAGAAGFELGPRESIGGELSQVVTFWQPPRENPSRAPAWYAWWIGLASGQVRREAMVSTRHYMITEYRDFNAPLVIEPPVADRTPPATPTRAVVTPGATPAAAGANR